MSKILTKILTLHPKIHPHKSFLIFLKKNVIIYTENKKRGKN